MPSHQSSQSSQTVRKIDIQQPKNVAGHVQGCATMPDKKLLPLSRAGSERAISYYLPSQKTPIHSSRKIGRNLLGRQRRSLLSKIMKGTPLNRTTKL